MSIVLKLPKDIEAAFAFQARAAQMPTERYLAHIVELAVESRRRMAAERVRHHLATMAECIAPGTTPGTNGSRPAGSACRHSPAAGLVSPVSVVLRTNLPVSAFFSAWLFPPPTAAADH